MIAQLANAVVRAILVLIVICTPSLLLPARSPDSATVVMLVALFAAAFTFSEYASRYPGLIEFRDAPPFNRVRVIGVFATLFLLSLVAGAPDAPQTLTLIVNATGLVLAHALDFSYSPIWLLQVFLPENASRTDLTMLRTMGGLSFLVGLITIAVFAILMRLKSWPSRNSSFNVWVNLPTFDPTAGGDVVARLTRDSRVNLILGFTLPFLMPVLASYGIENLDVSIAGSPQLMVWMVTLWSFLPVSLLMRGLAMGRIAHMITERRKQVVRDLAEQGALAAA
ncbi:hypothetical protein DZD18_03185 [Rhodobacteraceae bacterium W635]|nr:hypothetical protein DZD18_03185 [Rhodobacteraceae bacterium W635]